MSERGLDAPRSNLGQSPLDLPGLVDLELVAFLDVREVLEHDATLEAGRDLPDVVLQAPQRGDLAVVDDGAVAHQADLGTARDSAVGHVRAGDRADPGG